MRLLPCDDNLSLRGETLQEALDQDRKEGLIPFYVSLDFFLVCIYGFPQTSYACTPDTQPIHYAQNGYRWLWETYSERQRHNFRGLVSTISIWQAKSLNLHAQRLPKCLTGFHLLCRLHVSTVSKAKVGLEHKNMYQILVVQNQVQWKKPKLILNIQTLTFHYCICYIKNGP